MVELLANLDEPDAVYNKEDAWVSLAQLNAIGQAIWPTKMPTGSCCTGKGYARAAVMSLILRLWCRRPYRQRNIREMKLGDNLYKKATGTWMTRFIGEELKVGRKKGQRNHFELPFPIELVPDLEVYLSTWRALLIKDSLNPPTHVFLNIYGKPFKNEINFNEATSRTVHAYTGKHFHPHIIRTIWATEYIRETSDF